MRTIEDSIQLTEGPASAILPGRFAAGHLLLASLLVMILFCATGCLAPADETRSGTDQPAAETASAAAEGDYGHEWFADGPEEMAYVEIVSAAEFRAFEAMDRLKAAYPAAGADAVAAATEAVAAIEESYAEVEPLTAPAKYAGIHAYFVSGLDRYTKAGRIMADNDFAELEGDALAQAETLLNEASDQFAQMLDAIEALKTVWGSP